MYESFHTFIEVPSEFMVRTPFDHLCDVFGFLVDGHGSYHAAVWGRGYQFDLNRTGLGDLTVQLFEQR